MTAPSRRGLSQTALSARLAELQSQVFAHYETAAARAENDASAATEAYAAAERACAPLIAEAKALNDEHVRRLRRRAAIWWRFAIAIAVLGAVGVWSLLAVRR